MRHSIIFLLAYIVIIFFIVIKLIYGNKKIDTPLFFVSIYRLKNEKMVWSHKIIFEMKNCDEEWCGWKIIRGKN